MNDIAGNHRTPFGRLPPERLSPTVWGALLLLTLTIFAGVVAAITLYLRSEIRERIVSRDGEIFTAVAQMLLEEEVGESEPYPGDFFTTALLTSRLRGVLAARIHGPNGVFTDAVPFDAIEIPLSDRELDALRSRKTLSVFEHEGDLASVFEFYIPSGESSIVPLLHVAIPLSNPRDRNLSAIAYYTLDGQPVAAQFNELDRSLILQAGIIFSLGGLLFLAAAGVAFYRLNQAHSLLRERSERLIEANQQLILAAKTSAVGAVTAHLIHGLRNPLAGLNQFVHTAGGVGGGPAGNEDWQAAEDATCRMQTMIDEIVGILREEDATATYEVSLQELADLVAAKIRPRAEKARVDCKTFVEAGDAPLGGRDANLVILILSNLLENALQASGPGGLVRLGVDGRGEEIRFEVGDRGPGLPVGVRENLFSPYKQSGHSGCGLGLAISYQLACHLGARLDLKESGPSGTIFHLVLKRPGDFPA